MVRSDVHTLPMSTSAEPWPPLQSAEAPPKEIAAMSEGQAVGLVRLMATAMLLPLAAACEEDAQRTHMYGAYVWGICMGHMYGAYVWGIRMGHMYGACVWGMCKGHMHPEAQGCAPNRSTM